MHKNKLLAFFVSVVCALMLVPSQALAEMAAILQEEHAVAEQRINAQVDTDAWKVFDSVEEAELAAGDDAQVDGRLPVVRFDLRLVGAQGTLEYRTKEPGKDWETPETWLSYDASADEDQADDNAAPDAQEDGLPAFSDEDSDTPTAPEEVLLGEDYDGEAGLSLAEDEPDDKLLDEQADVQDGEQSAAGAEEAEVPSDAIADEVVAEDEVVDTVAAEDGEGESAPFSAIQIRLCGEAADNYDVLYRVRAARTGWQEWVSNGDDAKVVGEDGLESDEIVVDDIQVVLAQKEDLDSQEVPIEDVAEDIDVVDEDLPVDIAQEELGTDDDEGVMSLQETSVADEEQEADSGTSPVVVKPATPVVGEKLPAVPSVSYKAHVQSIGWMKAVKNGAVAGTSGRSLRVEALRINLVNASNLGITYRAHVQDIGWQGWKKNGATAGTSGRSLRVEALQIKLTGTASKYFDVWYRGHVQSIGWQGWKKNGATAGTSGRSLRVEAVQIKIAYKGSSAPTNASAVVGKVDKSIASSVAYRARNTVTGWQGWMKDGEAAGIHGISATLSGLQVRLTNATIKNQVRYSVYTQGKWASEVAAGKTAGSGKRIDAVKMRLTGTAAKNYDLYYRTYNGGAWKGWAKNNGKAGTVGLNRGIEAIQVKLVSKGGKAPGSTAKAYEERGTIKYRARMQTSGWQAWKAEGKVAGLAGKSKRMEGLQVKVSDSTASGEIMVSSYVQGTGWQSYVHQGKTSGSGGSKRTEAIKAKLTGELSKKYDLYYRAYVPGYGWLDWAKNNKVAGSTGMSLRMEAVQFKLTLKGATAPGKTKNPVALPYKTGYQNPAGYYQLSSKNVTITKAAKAPWNYVTPSRIARNATRTQCVNAFLQRAREYVGSPYIWNYSCAPGVGVDCIGLVYQCCYACGMDLGGGTGTTDFNPWAHYSTGYSGWHSHDANNFWNYGKTKHVPVSQRQAGDVLYWPGHVAIYMGGNTLIEAYTPSTGVIYSSLSSRATPSGCMRLFI